MLSNLDINRFKNEKYILTLNNNTIINCKASNAF